MCAVVGVINSKNASKIAYYALFSMQHRGQEASGISVSCNHNITTKKGVGLVTDVFSDRELQELKGDIAIGHNRYATSGNCSEFDTQPIWANYSLGQIAIVHNGNLVNRDEVREELVREGAIFQSSMDTENILHLIAKSQKRKLEDRIVEALSKTVGAYCFIIMSRSKIFVIRDKYGIRPLSIGRLEDGGYIIASESCAFDLVGAKFIRDVRPGEMLVFKEGDDEYISKQLFEDVDPRFCAFEYVYLARPDSIVEGKNVYEVRKKLGETLASRYDVPKADFVVPVPDSGVPAAMGYAAKSKIPFEMAIVRNHYVGRTFIEPTQEIRNLKVKLKLNPMAHLFKGKSVIVIDDSIVRGTTSKKIVELLRGVGVKEVHFRVACPEIKYPCKYGIDTPSYKELISANRTKDEVCRYIGADSLEFLNLNDFIESLGSERKYSLDSFDGDYFVK
ncbi:amidophosphoribosyltransferase [uncultured Campylobacter sp.]|uniref:amidophosphoribosyltransferase n=1 Tax=uncultured Campylobacter sp. TaxID=218934 RepID=UPI0026024836|nr:amidophosphoribosyltransferase [uncultured Campylobacter sp.]